MGDTPNGSHTTVDGEPWTYGSWANGEPSAGEACVTTYTHGTRAARLNNIRCGYFSATVCESEL